MKFTDRARFMASSLPNLAEGITKTKCKDCNGFLNMCQWQFNKL